MGVGDVWVGIGWSLGEGGLGFRWGLVRVGFVDPTPTQSVTQTYSNPPTSHPLPTQTITKPDPKPHPNTI